MGSDDWDFACSNTFRGYSFTHYGEHDPADIPPQVDLSAIESKLNELEDIIARPGAIPRQYQYQLQQLRGQVIYLQNKINEHIDKSRKRERPAKGVEL